MLILSVGMPRAGSGWYYNLMHDLVVAAGGTDARQIRSRYHLESILTEVNCNLGALTPRRLLLSLLPSVFGHTYVLKAHAAPTLLAKWLLRWGWMKAAYIYRDPRDALLSAYENGQRARKRGNRNAFAELIDFEHALRFMRQYVAISEQWLAIPWVLSTRYEDLLEEYPIEANRLAHFLGVDAAKAPIQAVIERYQPRSARKDQIGLHFRQGKVGRHRQVFGERELEILNQTFAPYLRARGYST
ncbi:MAG: sulfotransferase domain-containing protein [Anaerolineales bacterium]|nr:sulfotransferase domain-containing protein [Anaerolineales bacterium]MDW8161563.1 sulfotransferase domain-containing protein [Anaerolineales bacterium]